MSDAPECLFCGTCCFSSRDDYVPVSGSDHARLGADAERLTHFEGNRAFMRMVDGHCAALRLEAGTGRFFCTVYETRPETCRTLERGSPQCDAERALKGTRPLESLVRLRKG